MTLAQSHQLIMFDPRGAGKSERCPIETYDLEHYVEDVEALRQHLGIDNLNILGKSNGGVVAQAYALKYQQNIDHLILVATTPSFRFVDIAMKNLTQRGSPEQIEAGKKVLSGAYKNQQEVNEAFKILEPLYTDKGELIDASELEDGIDGIALEPLRYGFKTYLKHFDFVPQLNSIKNKTLIIAGDHDWVCDPSLAEIMHKEIPNSELIVLDGGHLMDHDQPELYIQTIVNFLAT